jgi:peptidyl-prolyl cis-trans isomerase SurA
MKKGVVAFFVLLSISSSAQTLFYYGNDSVSSKEFLRAWNKNNTGVKTEKAFRDYLDLYIASRLKIKEATERGYDTLPQIVSDLDNLRQQILPSYLNDKESVTRLVNESFTRSQKDIHLAHIFITLAPDSIAALKKLSEAMKKLDASVPFAEVAKQYSDDPLAQSNGGDLGWLTVFSLPYELENLAYNTAPGKVSNVYKSKSGYHIFKNLGERKDPGRIKAAQILLAFPPDTDAKARAKVKRLADSIYARLQKGDDFGKLAALFSNDVISSAANGQMQEFGVGEYEPAFENVVFSLPVDGAYSKPFLTSYGYHIVKRISRVPVATKSDKKAMQALTDKTQVGDRMASTRNELARKALASAGFKKAPFNEAELWALSDSLLNYVPAKMVVHLSNSSPLFMIGEKTIAVTDWINYAQTFRYRQDGSGLKSYPTLWDEFIQAMALEYYQNHLELFNEEFRQQLTEFKEGNLFFEIMQREVWGPAQNDSAALQAYYDRNRNRYTWNQSADAVIFYASDVPSAKTFGQELRKAPTSWHELLNNFSEKIAADSSRFELAQIPNPSKSVLREGVITAPLVNKADNTASLAYILKTYNKPAPRSFAEARGLVINDYQTELEKNWLASLKKKYPVRVNESLLQKLITEKKW